jgi:hypothetical protein
MRRTFGRGARSLLAIATLGLLSVPSVTGALPAHAAPPLFTECPAVGADTGCELLITVNPDGSASIYQDPNQPVYDGADDTLVGVINNASFPVPTIGLHGVNLPIMAFDGDGLCAYGVPGCPFGPTGYEGPGTSFSGISADYETGFVNFNGAGQCAGPGLPPGGTAYFSLESAATSATIKVWAPKLGEGIGIDAHYSTAHLLVSDTTLTSAATDISLETIPANPVLSGGAIDGQVIPIPNGIRARGAVGSVTVTPPVAVSLTASSVVATATLQCGNVVGTTEIGSLIVNGTPIPVGSIPPNTPVPFALGTLILNEQQVLPLGGLVVHAIHLIIPSQTLDVIIGSAQAGA